MGLEFFPNSSHEGQIFLEKVMGVMGWLFYIGGGGGWVFIRSYQGVGVSQMHFPSP